MAQQMQKAGQKVKINVDDILDKFDCPVCMCKLSDPIISACGHTFCKPCIEECVNRSHECPSCRKALTADQLFRNYSLELLINELSAEREKAQKDYFEGLAEKAIVKEG